MLCTALLFFFFFFNDTATTEIYTLSLHDALPISHRWHLQSRRRPARVARSSGKRLSTDRKSTRLNSSHLVISYAVFCLKKKKKSQNPTRRNARHTRTSQRKYSIPTITLSSDLNAC